MRTPMVTHRRQPIESTYLFCFTNHQKTMAYTYHIECPCLDKWNPFIKGRSRGYCDGYMDAMRGQLPRLHLLVLLPSPLEKNYE